MPPVAPPTRLSAGVVIVSVVNRKLKFLLLRAYRNWDFPKGLVEAGEEPIDAAVREVREETALDDISFDWGLEFMDTGPVQQRQDLPVLHRPQQGDAHHAAHQSGPRGTRAPRGALGGLPQGLSMVSPRLTPVVRWAYRIVNHGRAPDAEA